MKRLLCTMLVIVLCFSSFCIVSKGDCIIDEYVSQLIEIDESFFSDSNLELIDHTEDSLVSPLGSAKLIQFYEDTLYKGYCIIVEDAIVEFSSNLSPYTLTTLSTPESQYYYDFANYGLIDSSFVLCIDSAGNALFDDLQTELVPIADGINGIITGVSPQLQLSSNCIAAALANVMWYWNSHGWSSLAPNGFSSLRSNLHSRFSSLGFANNNVPTVANQYGATCSPRVWFSSNVYWTTSPTYVFYEIDAGYPCMLGYAAGDTSQGLTYSTTVGHMTMCFGYYYVGNQLYVTLADGHSSGTKTKIWCIYNDCTISVRPYSL
ncbi:MAG: hypothetical protein IJM76_08620 [Lachnospiraceae bacterium]|nr:hypothetical protein [Lachnospiraceae bacterium]